MDRSGKLNTEDALEELKSKHNRERKELLARITALKHGLTKNDKKRKKEVGQQSEQMETELRQRHEKEMAQLECQIEGIKMKKGAKNEERAEEQNEDGAKGQDNQSTETVAMGEGTPFFKELKLTKAQMKKEKKRAEKANARNKAETEDAENATNSRGNLEKETIRQILDEKALELVEVSPDGDCLYSAVAHQANVSGLGKFSAFEIRRMAADYMQQNREDFLPFLANENGEMFKDEQFDEYCSKVARMCTSGGTWGGEPELRALSCVLRCPIEVLHADGATIKFGEVFSGHPLIVTYHKFAYTLGEHYNSTKPTGE
ncbi:hypothetical protein niasHS_007307 [Heterodera schachtii]|uniref:OTU domain-containing protein n=1 Tax=Heterodera schachtii TaxID=97005 RepID=A0ABD2JJZ0_HETSC